MIDYSIFYKDCFSDASQLARRGRWDFFISAFNQTERVRQVYDGVTAGVKHWLIHNEYGFSESEFPREGCYARPDLTREDEFIVGFLDTIADLSGSSICIDISGFMRPHLMFLMIVLTERGVRTVDVVYAEPVQYQRQELTEFTRGDVTDVRPIAGLGGNHQPSLSPQQDVLIIAAGYEDELIRQVANAKSNAKKFQILGFPPLQADFYQENRLKVHRAAESLGASNEASPLVAPANDPFVTASVVQNMVEREEPRSSGNIYLCPLSSRPQTLGLALYYLYEGRGKSLSVIYPFTRGYAPDTANGISRVWHYKVELP